MGVGIILLYLFVLVYIDENVYFKVLLIYFGIFFVGVVVGSGFGFVVGGLILNNVYVDIK